MQNRPLNFSHFTAESEEGRLLFTKIKKIEEEITPLLDPEEKEDVFFIKTVPQGIEKDLSRSTWKIHGQTYGKIIKKNKEGIEQSIWKRGKEEIEVSLDGLIQLLIKPAEDKALQVKPNSNVNAEEAKAVLHSTFDQLIFIFNSLLNYCLNKYGFLPSFYPDRVIEIEYEKQAFFYKIICPKLHLQLFDSEGSAVQVGILHGPVTIKYEAIPSKGGIRFVEANIPSPIIQKLLEEVLAVEEKEKSFQKGNFFALKKLEQLIQKVPLAELYYTLYPQEIDKVLPEEKKIDHKFLIENFLPNKDKYLKIRANILELKLKITDEIIKISAKAQELEEEAKSMPVKMHGETISIHDKDKLEKIQLEFAKKQVELNTDAKILNDIASDFSKAANDFFQKLATEPESAAKEFQKTCISLTKYGPNNAKVLGRDYGPKDYREFAERHRGWWTPTVKNILLCVTLVGLLILGIHYLKTGHLFFKRDSMMRIENTGKRMREEADELAKLVSSKKLKR